MAARRVLPGLSQKTGDKFVMIKLLTFDLDNTLWDADRIVLRAELAMRQWIREQHPGFAEHFDFRDFPALREAVLRERGDIAHDLAQLRLEALRRAFRQQGYASDSAETAAQGAYAVFFHERNVVELFPGARDALTRLRQDYSLYALSNGTADIQRVGLSDIFSRHFSAISVGAAKPDPRMYRAALAAAGVEPAQVIHIGDHPEQDVQAAAAVGMRTIWVNFAGQDWSAEAAPPDAQLRDFSELRALVQRLAQK